jgi:hypothetical protein
MRIVIETIPHDKQAYDTVGNYFYEKDGTLRIQVSEMGNPDYEFLVALHELVEVKLCEHLDIKIADIDAFDINFEKERSAGQHGDDEPGFAPDAPYRLQHTFATGVEMMMASLLNIDWSVYDKELNEL